MPAKLTLSVLGGSLDVVGDRRRRPWRAPARQAPRDRHGRAAGLAVRAGTTDGSVMAAIELRDVRKSFQSLEVIHGINLAVDEGAFTVFVGPSGCGKSTLLRMIAGLEEVSSGEVHIDGKRCDHLLPSARGMAMVFQSYALYPHMSVEQNLRFGLENLRTPKAEIDKRVARAAEILQIEPSDEAPAEPALRRPEPARRHRPRHRQGAQGLPVRRAAVQPRRRAQGQDARRAGRAAPPARSRP